MEFFVDMAGCSQSYIASRPVIFSYSLNKRLFLRYQVWEVLKANDLVARDWSICSLIQLTDKEFMERFVLRYKDLAPNLHQTYIACGANQISP